MSRQITVNYFCDNAAAEHEPRTVEGDTYLIYSPKQSQVVEVDVCDPCVSGIPYAQMQEIADLYGRKQTDAEVDPSLVCPHTDCKRHTEPFKDEGGKHRHLTRAHGEEPRSKTRGKK